MTDRKYSRREQFEEIERDSLRKLNPIRFELKQRYRATVMKNGHVRLGIEAKEDLLQDLKQALKWA